MMKRLLLPVISLLSLLCLGVPAVSGAQVVQPVIAEYTKAAEGSFTVTNQSGEPEVVTLEPRSFTLDADGGGTFRALDPSIHLELSAQSVRLEPQQTARIFYTVNADALPAWLCVYASFSPLKEHKGINLRVMLPHTIYLYGRDGLKKEDVVIRSVRYDSLSHRVLAEISNESKAAVRVAEVEVDGSKGASEIAGGFPLLPGMKRTVSVKWDEDTTPQVLHLRFPKFQFKLPINVVTE